MLYQPDEWGNPTSIARYVFGTDPISELDLRLFEIQTVLGKGRDPVVHFNIVKGTRMLCEKPLFILLNLSSISLMGSNIAAKLQSLSKTQQRQFLFLHNNFPDKQSFSDTVKINALPCDLNSQTDGIYSIICLINYSCLSNAHNNRNSDTEREIIHTIRYIDAGEGIIIFYDKDGLFNSRRNHLNDVFDFNCDCSLCSLSPLDL